MRCGVMRATQTIPSRKSPASRNDRRRRPHRQPSGIHRIGHLGRFTLGAALLFAGACQEPADPPASARAARVFITETELLDPPLVVRERVYTAARTLSLGNPGEPLEVAGFFFTVLSDADADVRISVRDVHSGAALTCERFPAPTTAPVRDFTPDLLSEEMLSRLADGVGVYWRVPLASEAHELAQRLAVVLPQALLGPRTTIEAYASTTSTGAPLAGDRIELARSFFYMAALGDSAMWGNGLQERDKFTSLVAGTIERELGVRVVRVVMAVSGATIRTHSADGVCTTRCGDGEIPQVFTSITTQANILPSPEIYDLILLDGCGNDVKLENILSSQNNTNLIIDLSNEFCMGEMANLLIRVRERSPAAPIVVTGYFPFVSEESDLTELGTWAAANGIDLGTEEDLAAALVNFVVNSAVFQSASRRALAAAVNLVVSLDKSDPPIVFVDPKFGPQNATLASDPWLWGLTRSFPVAQQLNINLSLFPEDPLLFDRVRRCGRGDVAPNLLACVYGALGHPNRAGARAYAAAIEVALRDIGLLLPEVPD